jgi:hypothetical protein
MISILNKRSTTHPNWCEDNYFIEETDEFIVGAVLDGCSTGINSHFASTAFKYALEKAYSDDNSAVPPHPSKYDAYFCTLTVKVHGILKDLKSVLNLSDLHLLSTVIFFIYNKHKCELYVRFIGDGTIVVNGVTYKNDELNTPDYLTYHIDYEWFDFLKWIRTRRVEQFVNVQNFAICTDGIDSFVNLKNPHIPKQIAIDFLLRNDEYNALTNQLNKKFNILTSRDEELKRSDELYWWDIKDDLTIIKYATL